MKDPAKLPDWARKELERLWANEKLQAEEAEQSMRGAGALVRHRLWSGTAPYTGLPDRAVVEFGTMKRYAQVCIAQNGRVSISGSGQLCVLPLTSHCITLTVEEF